MSSLLFEGSAAAPEVQLVFLADDLSTDAVRKHGAHLPTLENALRKSATALTLPFTTAHDSHLFVRASRVAGHEAEAYFAKSPPLFSNGVIDTVVVELPTDGGASVAENRSSMTFQSSSSTR